MFNPAAAVPTQAQSLYKGVPQGPAGPSATIQAHPQPHATPGATRQATWL